MRNVEKLIFYFLELKRENLFDYQFTQTWRMCLHKICQYKKVSYFQTIYMKQNTYNINHRKFTKNIASSIVLSENAKNDVIFSTLEPISSTKGIVSWDEYCVLKVLKFETVLFEWALVVFTIFSWPFVKEIQNEVSTCFYQITYKLWNSFFL
jgi:hypothetical protein